MTPCDPNRKFNSVESELGSSPGFKRNARLFAMLDKAAECGSYAALSHLAGLLAEIASDMRRDGTEHCHCIFPLNLGFHAADLVIKAAEHGDKDAENACIHAMAHKAELERERDILYR